MIVHKRQITVGFDTYHCPYASDQEGEWPVVGFSPRKRSLTLHSMSGLNRYDGLLAKPGQ